MSRTILSIALLPLLSIATYAQPEAAPTGATAGCLLKIRCDPSVLTLNFETLNALIGTGGITSKATQQAFGKKAVPQPHALRFHTSFALANADGGRVNAILNQEFSPVSEALGADLAYVVCKLSVTIKPADDNASPTMDPKAFLEAFAAQIEKALSAASEDELRRLQERLLRFSGKEKLARARLDDLRAKLLSRVEAHDGMALSRDVLIGEITELRRQASTLEMDRMATESRRYALEKHIAQLGKESPARKWNHAILGELERVVQFREQEVARLAKLRENDYVSDAALRGAEEALAMARIRLFEQRNLVEGGAGRSELVASLNRDLVMQSVSIVELETRLAFVKRRLVEIKKKGLLRIADGFEMMRQIELPQAETALARAIEEHANMQARLEAFAQPTVTIIAGQ
ncbi:MAG: hypothetical protein IH986_18770 [Planctomycetes bacterium]|nr:hypothetical protein [Planctomycetota bacterium]